MYNYLRTEERENSSIQRALSRSPDVAPRSMQASMSSRNEAKATPKVTWMMGHDLRRSVIRLR